MKNIRLTVVAFIAMALVLVMIPGTPSKAAGDLIPQYRLLNRVTGEHFYCTDVGERDSLLSGKWIYEGITGLIPRYSENPIYRLCNLSNGDHHYTPDKNEKDTLAESGAWRDEGIGWYSGGEIPVYRLYNPKAIGTGAHHYTPDAYERDQLILSGWMDEGIGWNVSSPEGFTDSNPVPEKPVQVFTGSDITAVGDSVMLGAMPALQSAMPGCVVDATVSRQAINTLDTLKALDLQGKLGKVVILAVGTNGPFMESVGQDMINYLGEDREIFWVNVYGNSIRWRDESNNTIRVLVDKNPNITLIDWNGEAASHPDWFYDDGIHLRSAGQSGYADLVYRTVFGLL